jgi:hypothetical protein
MNEPNQPEEKFDEKDREKREEKSEEEKYRRDPLGAIIWAFILIWIGVVWLADNLGYLDQIRSALAVESPAWLERIGLGAWPLVFIGAGVILLFEVLIRLVVPAYRRSVTGTIILAVVFIGIGLGNLTNWSLIWPLILIAIGVSIVFRALFHRRD